MNLVDDPDEPAFSSVLVSYDVERQGQIVRVTRKVRQPIADRYIATVIYPTALAASIAEARLKVDKDGCWWICFFARESELKKRGDVSLYDYPGAQRFAPKSLKGVS